MARDPVAHLVYTLHNNCTDLKRYILRIRLRFMFWIERADSTSTFPHCPSEDVYAFPLSSPKLVLLAANKLHMNI